MSQIAYAAAFLRVVQESLGLGDQPVSRAVIDISAGGAVRVLLERYVRDDELEKLGALLREIPKVNPGVEWVDRIAVEGGNGEVRVTRLEQPDSPDREAMKAYLLFLRHASPESRARVREMIEGGF